MSVHLDWDACCNARDLGETRVGRGRFARGVVVRSDSLSRLTGDGWAALAAHGVRTVVDLRSDGEAERDPVRAADGVGYRRLPIFDVVRPAAADAFAAAQSWPGVYEVMLDHFRAGFAAAVAAVADAAPGGVAVHCRVGRDRTGLVVACLLELAGASRETVHEDYAHSTARLAPAYDGWIRDEPDAERRTHLEWERAAPPDLILTALAHLDERYGGVEPYLAGAGVDVGRARARLTS